MSVKTLNSAQPMVLPANISGARTYSIAPGSAYVPQENTCDSADQIDSFLEGENPLGCIRGVIWVMAFNLAVFLLGAAIWQCVKFLK